MHEVIHLADNLQFVAYSESWIKIAKPFLEVANGDGVKTSNWPDQRFSTLVESFAEYTTLYLEGEKLESENQFRTEVLPLLICPSKKVLEWGILVRKGKQELEQGHFENAKKSLEGSVSLFPRSLSPYCFLIVENIYANDRHSAEHQLETFLTLLKTLNLAQGDCFEEKSMQLITKFCNQFPTTSTLWDKVQRETSKKIDTNLRPMN